MKNPDSIDPLVKKANAKIKRLMKIARGWLLDPHLDFYLNDLTSAVGLTLPKKVGSLSLDGLTSAEGLTLPENFKGWLSLDGLTSAVGLTLPTKVGYLHLNGLTSAEGLTLPEDFEGYLYLNSLPESDKEALRKRHPNLADKIK